MPRYTPIVDSLPDKAPFIGTETLERASGIMTRARIGANESLFGPSPKAVAAMQATLVDAWRYADPENFDLKAAIAAHHGISPDNVATGEGIDGLLGLVVRMVVKEGTPVVTSAGAYPTFNFHVAGFGGVLTQVPFKDDHEDLDGLLDAVKKTGAALVYVSNPDNPMGNYHSADKIATFLDALPEGTLLCYDEAYVEFAPHAARLPLDVDDPRLIRMRTFSKAYGMAAMRVAYALGSADLCANFNKVRNHFGVNRIAQIGAIAALEDQDWLNHVIAQVEKGRERIGRLARQEGLTPLPSATNFVTIDCHGGAELATAIVQEMGKRGVFIRMPFVAPQNRCIRISVGDEPAMAVLEQEFSAGVAAARAAVGENA
ncbi:MAG: pyridoxal phosphate-dependent aminotransferase [Pseudomonadota bacterium]